MARPQKYTVDYFSHDANASEGKTLTILFNHFGHEGISAWWMLLEIISRTNNHVIGIRNPEEMEFLAAKMRFKPERLKEILRKIADLEAIDKELYDQKLIWCQNFVNRLTPLYHHRGQEPPSRPDITFFHPIVNMPENPVSGPDNPVSSEETIVSDPDNTQTKERKKESKTKESIQKKYFGEFKNVILSEEELNKLKTRFPSGDAERRIERLSAYLASKGTKYKNHYAVILSWAQKEERQEVGNHGTYRQRNRAIPGQTPAGAFDDLE